LQKHLACRTKSSSHWRNFNPVITSGRRFEEADSTPRADIVGKAVAHCTTLTSAPR
jgi:hypothetical protein